MTRLGTIALAVSLASAPASAEELIRRESPHSVSVTMDRLQAAVEKAGATVFAHVDHAKGAANVGSEIPANQVLYFGNPKLGTPLIADAPGMGLDLPMRVSAYDDNGQTIIVYRAAIDLAAAHNVPDSHPSVVKMAGALDKLTAVAIAAE